MAALLTDEPVLIKGAPLVNERLIVEELFESLGGKVAHLDDQTIQLDASSLISHAISSEICRKNRISILAAEFPHRDPLDFLIEIHPVRSSRPTYTFSISTGSQWVSTPLV